MIELSTSVSSLRHLRESDLGAYDAIYLGNLYCRRYEGNLLEEPDGLREAIRLVRGQGRRARLTTYAAVRNDALPVLRAALAAACGAGAEAVEVHTLGLVRLVREEFPALAVHVGNFANVYTDLGASLLRDLGVARITPGYELALDEADAVAREAGVPLELVVHGKLPLGISDTCLLLEHETAWGARCPDLCQREVFLEREEWALKSVGTGILGGLDVCLLDHLPRLLAAGHRHFRVEALSESPAYRAEVGRVYRAALERALGGDPRLEPEWGATLRRHSRRGLCNGFAFGRSGIEFVHATPR
jgi:putative protease